MRKQRFFPWRLWTWWNARRDRRYNLPFPEATALGETEQYVQTAVNIVIRNTEQRFARKADPLASKLAEVREALSDIYEPEYDHLQKKVGRRDVRVYLSRTTNFVLLGFLTVGEMAFNLVAFNVFREPAFFTALMALAVAVAIPLCAFAIGISVRQWPPPTWKTGIKVLVVTGVVVAVLAGINRVRLAYLKEQAPEFVGSHPELGLAFFTVNIVILVAAALVTYLAHDPEPGFAEAKANAERCRERARELEGRLDKLTSVTRAEVGMAKEAGWQLLAYYRMVNRRGRKRVPRYFDDAADANHRPAFVEVEVGRYREEIASSGKQTERASA